MRWYMRYKGCVWHVLSTLKSANEIMKNIYMADMSRVRRCEVCTFQKLKNPEIPTDMVILMSPLALACSHVI